MWGSGVPDDGRMSRLDSQMYNSLHNDSQPGAAGVYCPWPQARGAGDIDAAEGTWGERDAGVPSEAGAREEYETLQRELTNNTRTRSRSAASRTTSRRGPSRQQTHRSTATTGTRDEQSQAGEEVEKQEDRNEDDFELDEFMRGGHLGKRTDGRSAKKVGVVYKDLNVQGVGSSASFVRTLPDAVIGTFGPDLYKLLSSFLPFLKFKGGDTRTLINDFTGVVRDGMCAEKLALGFSLILESRRNDARARKAWLGMFYFSQGRGEQPRVLCISDWRSLLRRYSRCKAEENVPW